MGACTAGQTPHRAEESEPGPYRRAKVDHRSSERLTNAAMKPGGRRRRTGALALIAAGGGRVEPYPHDLRPEKTMSSSFLYNATRTMYERLGFSYERHNGNGNCVMSLIVRST